MPDGSLVMNTQGATSNVGTSINLAGAIRESASKQAEIATTHSEQEARSYSDASSSSFRQVAELSQHAGHTQGTGQGWNMSMNAATASAINKVQQLTQRFANDHHMSYGDAARVLSHVAGDLRAGIAASSPSLGKNIFSVQGSGGISARREADHSTSSDDRKLYSEAKDYIENSGYSQSVDVVERAVHDKSLKINDDQGERLLNNMNASYDKAQSAKHDMMQSIQETQSYRQLAQQAEDQALNINSNLSQVFMDWLSNQPGTNGKGHMGTAMAENMFVHHPELAKHYAEQFGQQYTKNLIQHQQHLPTSQQAVKDIGIHNKEEQQIHSHFNQNTKAILNQALQKHLVLNAPLDESVKTQTEQKIKYNNQRIQKEHKEIEAKGAIRSNKVHQEEEHNHKRHGLLIKDVITGIDINES